MNANQGGGNSPRRTQRAQRKAEGGKDINRMHRMGRMDPDGELNGDIPRNPLTEDNPLAPFAKGESRQKKGNHQGTKKKGKRRRGEKGKRTKGRKGEKQGARNKDEG
jgi:hypothetical protein